MELSERAHAWHVQSVGITTHQDLIVALCELPEGACERILARGVAGNVLNDADDGSPTLQT
jgi:hypothetical protein